MGANSIRTLAGPRTSPLASVSPLVPSLSDTTSGSASKSLSLRCLPRARGSGAGAPYPRGKPSSARLSGAWGGQAPPRLGLGFEPPGPGPIDGGPSLLAVAVCLAEPASLVARSVPLSCRNQLPKSGLRAGTDSAMSVPLISDDSIARKGL